MSRGLYTAAAGLLVGIQRQESLGSAFANASTPGFKADLARARAFPSVLARTPSRLAAAGGRRSLLGSGVVLDRVGIDLRAGLPTPTGAPLDLALEGTGFFAVRGPDARLRLTRDGHFAVDRDGFLVTARGLQALDEDGAPINVGSGDVHIRRDRSVIVDGLVVARLRVVEAPMAALLRAGESTFLVAEEALLTPSAAIVLAGSLEGSNVQPTAILTEMAGAARAYESAQRLFATQNRLLGIAAAEIGRV